jgi:D-3-phosphoglycerate dehydrogenase
MIIRGGVGLDNIDLDYARSKGIRVHNTASASSIAVAEMTFALMLSVPTRLIEAHNSMKEGRWAKKELKRTELYGKTLGLVGAGNIGTEVARRAAAFGMTVVAYDPIIPSHQYARLVSFDELLGQADYITLHVPLIDATRGMINAGTIAKMKDGVVVVNTARALCVVQEDMAAALESGKVRAYATDVWPNDPPKPSNPLLKAPNVVMSPHIGAGSRENMLRIGDVVVEILSDFVKEIG